MTELRNRPGEILDRVADDGQAFIIERGGQRKACLVPLSIFLPDVSPSRIADEISACEESGEKARVVFNEDNEISFRFAHTLPTRGPVQVDILLPHGYPNSCPRIYANPIQDDPPHRWHDGALCLYGVVTGWNPGKHTVLSTLELARQWLNKYESWSRTGAWPGQEGMSNE